MGRIGKRIINIPDGVAVAAAGGKVLVKGPKGALEQECHPAVEVEISDKKVSTKVKSNDPKVAALQGLYNSLIKNMIDGVTKGFEKRLEIEGVGYRAVKQGKKLQLQMGYSHPIIIDPPAGVEILVEGTNKIVVSGADKQAVGAVASKIRKVREVEPYKGKGLRYAGELVKKKAGKAAKAAAAA